MKKILLLLLSVLCLSAPRASAQLGFDFGMNYEFLSRKVPEGFKSNGFGMGPYVGMIYGIPVSMSAMVNVGLNYKFDILWGAMGAWDDESKLDAITLGNYDTSIQEHHLQLPVSFNYGTSKGWNLFAGPVFDYCLASTTSSTDKDWPHKDDRPAFLLGERIAFAEPLEVGTAAYYYVLPGQLETAEQKKHCGQDNITHRN